MAVKAAASPASQRSIWSGLTAGHAVGHAAADVDQDRLGVRAGPASMWRAIRCRVARAASSLGGASSKCSRTASARPSAYRRPKWG